MFCSIDLIFGTSWKIAIVEKTPCKAMVNIPDTEKVVGFGGTVSSVVIRSNILMTSDACMGIVTY